MTAHDDIVLIGSGGTASPVLPEVAGSKAAQLWRMAQLGLDVPPAFVIPTVHCAGVNAGDDEAMAALRRGLDKGIAWMEQALGRRFGGRRSPLLVSVRSGARKSMPGMLDTVLNVGLNDETLRGLIRASGNPRLAFDSYRRMIQGYAETVDRVPRAYFQRCLDDMIRREGVGSETELDPEALERLAEEFRDVALRHAGQPLPDDPREQLLAAAVAVYRSWDNPRAREYRRLNRLNNLKGTAVTVQAMVFGNSGGDSGSGVAFSRNPSTGANQLYVDFLFDAQGEDVVSGRRTPDDAIGLAARLPRVATQLAESVRRVEREFLEAQDVEFTVAEGRLYFLQTRAAKCTPAAALRIAVDMVQEGLIDPRTALARLAAIDFETLSVSRFAGPAQPIATAIPAATGVAAGRAAFDSDRAKELASTGEPAILVRSDTSTEDVEGFTAAAGILTATGGRTAHAAVVARQFGKVCLVGCRTLAINEDRSEAVIGDARIRAGDWLSLDGDTGDVFLGRRAIVNEKPPEIAEVERWRTQVASAPK